MLGAYVSDPLIKSICLKSSYCVCLVTVLKPYCVMGGASFRVGIVDEFKPICKFCNGSFQDLVQPWICLLIKYRSLASIVFS